MLKDWNNLIFIFLFYILFLWFEFLHLGSDVNLIIMLESLLCFTILAYFIKGSFQNFYRVGLNSISLKFKYIQMLGKSIISLYLQSSNSIFGNRKGFYLNWLNSFQSWKKQIMVLKNFLIFLCFSYKKTLLRRFEIQTIMYLFS